MLTNLSSLEAILIALVVVAFFIVRQFSTRRVASAWMVLVPLALLYFGATSFGQLGSAAIVLLAINVGLGAALGVVRGKTFRIWVDERGQALMRGTRLTLLFWALTIAVKIVLSIVERQAGLGDLASSSGELLIPVAATLAVQNLVVFMRSQGQRLVAA